MNLQSIRPVCPLAALLVTLFLIAACPISNTLDPLDRPCAKDQPCGPGSICDPGSGRCIAAVSSDAAAQDMGGGHDQSWVDRNRADTGPDLMAPDQIKTDFVCPLGTTSCYGVCVKLSSDPQHCGECSRSCPTNTTDQCEDTQCVCGNTGAACSNGLNCVNGTCVCIASGLCPGCCQEGTCIQLGSSQDSSRCGKAGALCASCDDSQGCTSDQCRPTGDCEHLPLPAGGPCDDGIACTHTDQCHGGVCSGITYSCAGGSSCATNTCTGEPPPNHCTLVLDPTFCLIDGNCHADGTLNPDNACLQCRVSESASSWIPEQIITPCDPLTSADCTDGAACYLVGGEYLDCICDLGDQTLGESCNTSTECAPGLGCFSSTSTPPGVCQLLCDPLAGDCALGLPCKALNNYPTYGTCRN